MPTRVDRRSAPRSLTARAKRFVIIASEFNPSITRALVRGASDMLRRHGALAHHIRLLWVPGAFELPVVAARVVASRPRPDAIIAIGAILRGETPQYEVLAHAVAQGLSQVAVSSAIPVTFGLVVATTRSQAKARAGGSMGNRGAEAALAALAVLRLFDQLNTDATNASTPGPLRPQAGAGKHHIPRSKHIPISKFQTVNV